MKVGVNEAAELKALAEEKGIPFANLLWTYVLEDLLLRIGESSYEEYLWLQSHRMLGEEACRRGEEGEIIYLYQQSSRLPAPEKLVPGQKLSAQLAEQFVQEVFLPENKREIGWKAEVAEQNNRVTLEFQAFYKDMTVPVTVEIRSISMENQRPEVRTFSAVSLPGKTISCQIYSSENQVGRDLFEIMEKLELIGDMGAYDRLYQTLKSQSLSGRYVLEELEMRAEAVPQVKKERRLLQLKEYRNYAYMRKRWEQYEKRHGKSGVTWEDALDLILALAEPVWNSLCNGGIFFDDWMPELGRLL